MTDTGIGMDEATLERVFDPFTQADEATTRNFGGTGLGLSICRHLATLLGGNLIATFEPGVGSTFILTLPARPGEKELSASDEDIDRDAYCRAKTPAGLKILVVDDIATNRMVLKAMLERYEADVTLACDGEEALTACDNQAFDLILSDIQMPAMSGTDPCRAIRAKEQTTGTKRTPVFAITANVFEHQSQEYLEAGMDGLVHKPFVLADLESALVSAAPQVESGLVELF